MTKYRARRGIVPYALALGGAIVAGVGLYTFIDSAKWNVHAQRQSDAMVERVMNSRSSDEFIREAEGYHALRMDSLRKITAQGAQQGLNLELMPAGNFGEAISHVFTAQDFSDAANDFAQTFRTRPSAAEAAMFALRKRNLESMLDRQKIPHVPSMERSLMRQYDQLINQERNPLGYEELRQKDPQKFGKLNDDQILEQLASGLVTQKVREMRDFVIETRADLEKAGVRVTDAMLEKLLDVRFSQGRPAFDRAVLACKDQSRQSGFRGSFSGPPAGPGKKSSVEGSCLLDIQGSTISGRFEGYQQLDLGYPAKVECSFSGPFDAKTGKFSVPVRGKTTVQWTDRSKQKTEIQQVQLEGQVSGQLTGTVVKGYWYVNYTLGKASNFAKVAGTFQAQK